MTTTLPTSLVTLAALIGAAGVAHARSGPAAICLVHEADADGLGQRAVAASVGVERRKAGLEVELIQTDSVAQCPTEGLGSKVMVVVITAGPRVVLVEGGGHREMSLAAVEPLDRAPELARAVIAHVVAPGTSKLKLATSIPVKAPAAEGPATGPEERVAAATARPDTPAGTATRAADLDASGEDEPAVSSLTLSFGPAVEGGADGLSPVLNPGVELALDMRLLSEAARLDVVVSYMAPMTHGAQDIESQRLALIGRVFYQLASAEGWRGLFGAGAGACVTFSAPPGEGPTDTWAFVLEPVVGLGFDADPLRVTLTVFGRWYSSGLDYETPGMRDYRAPRFTVGTALRLGVTL